MRAHTRRPRTCPSSTLALALALTAPALGLLPRQAAAQLQLGQIQGAVSDDRGHKLPGVTVVISGPSLQGDLSEATDASGRYLITQIPPGDGYVVRFYFGDTVVERPGVRISQGSTLTISVPMPSQRAEKVVIRERAPNVDTAGANTGVELNQEVLQNTAVRGRTFESVLTLAPGTVDPPRGVAGGDVGTSIGGSTGNENVFLIDGLNTTDPNTGVLGTQLSQYFIKDVNVITGGYQAEYGRATGGVVSIVTKTGSNEFHGSVFGSLQPLQLDASPVSRLGEALAIKRRADLIYDVGFDLGGPIWKDRIWFYVGFAPTFTSTRVDRVLRNRVRGADGKPQVDPGYECPSYLSDVGGDREALCYRSRPLALRTIDAGSQALGESRSLYNGLAKLQFNLGHGQSVTLSYLGSPEQRDEYSGYRDDLNSTRYSAQLQLHDVSARYIGRFWDNRLQLDVMYGLHYQETRILPQVADKANLTYLAPGTDPLSLADFEGVAGCKRDGDFNPCPLTRYATGGFGQYTKRQLLLRHVVLASATYFAKLWGTHAIKLGFDFEDNLSDNTHAYTGTPFDPNDKFSGTRTYTTDPTGKLLRWNRAYAQLDPKNAYGETGVPCGPTKSGGLQVYCFDQARAETETRNFSLYLRDSWNVSFLPGLVVNLGLRWEGQELYGQRVGLAPGTMINGQDAFAPQIAIYSNLAPRVGLAYDVTRRGRSKLFVNYGRFYESIPMNINDRTFSGQGLVIGNSASYSGNCATQKSPDGRDLPVPQAGPNAPCDLPPGRTSGGSYGLVLPGLSGQYINEVVAGFQYDVGLDVVLGISYTFRNLGNIVEDLSVNGGTTYFIANPGQSPSPQLIQQLEDDAAQRQRLASSNPADSNLAKDAQIAKDRVVAARALSTFPAPRRDYHALTFTAQKRLSNRFALVANYTYARLLGNYPGTFSPNNNQLDPNISSQYDVVDLLRNRNGPLSNDRPHNLKLLGIYVQPIGRKGTLTASLTFTAYSGRPIDVIGSNPDGRTREVFILPRGSGGRTPMVSQLDAHLGYEHQLPKSLRLSLYLDVVNLLNQRAVTNVDDEYTASAVLPILGGKLSDLRRLQTVDGQPLVVNSNYGQPTSYQEPLFLRLGARLAF